MMLDGVFDEVMPVVMSLFAGKDVVEFIVPKSKLSTTDIDGDLILVVDGVHGIGDVDILVENGSGDGMSGDVPEGAIATIDGNNYTVDEGSRASAGKLRLKILVGLVSGLVGGEDVSFSVKSFTIMDAVPLSTDSYYAVHSSGEVTFGFEYARVAIGVVPKVGWVCNRGGESGQVVFADILPNVVVVWVGKVGTRQ